MAVLNPTEQQRTSMSTRELIARFDDTGETKRVTIDIPPKLHAVLKQAAAREDRFLRDLAAAAFVDYLKKHHPHLL